MPLDNEGRWFYDCPYCEGITLNAGDEHTLTLVINAHAYREHRVSPAAKLRMTP